MIPLVEFDHLRHIWRDNNFKFLVINKYSNIPLQYSIVLFSRKE